jgi:predicted metal-dependent enzyme (double-stranded beta helix superfamily)
MQRAPHTALPCRTCAGLPLPPPVADLLHAVERAGDLTPARAAALLRAARLTPADLTRWQDLRHPAADSYGRKLIGRGPRFELMLMSWAPGDYSAIHDHGRAEWGAVRYFGAADHVVFDLTDGALSIRERMQTRGGDVYEVDAELIHLMGNSGDRPLFSLHLYGRAEPDAAITGSARVFDLFEDRIQRTDGGVFHCLPEREIARREPGPAADAETRLLHHRLMLGRVERMLAARATNLALHRRARLLRVAITRLEAEASAGWGASQRTGWATGIELEAAS